MSSMTIAQRLRSSIKMYAGDYRVRGEWITLREAVRRTGLPYHVLRQRIEDGDLPAVDVLCIDSASIAEEEDAALVARLTDFTQRMTGKSVTPDRFEQLFGSAEDRIARARGEAVAS